eukprot:JZ551035.1.p1 GENE.JZ551035.1~~JZ551035.1.p1  ORF type:complete len:183 (+),score=51.61 JZ551035.1:13-561(+)
MCAEVKKVYFSYEEIHRTIQHGAAKIKASGFEPDYIIGIGGSGFIPARILRTWFNKPILAISLARYFDEHSPNSVQSKPYKLQWVTGVDANLNGKKILLVDDVDDCRTTLCYAISELVKEFNVEIAVFVIHNKLKKKDGDFPAAVKHVFVGKEIEDLWAEYPWDAEDIDEFNKLTDNHTDKK